MGEQVAQGARVVGLLPRASYLPPLQMPPTCALTGFSPSADSRCSMPTAT